MKTVNAYGMPCEGCMIGTAFQKLTAQLERILKQENLDIKAGDYMILRALYNSDGLQQCELSELIGKDKSSICRSVSNLLQKGLVKTEPISYKCVRVWLTDKAEELRPIILKIAEERQKALYDLAPERDIEGFVKVLKAIINS